MKSLLICPPWQSETARVIILLLALLLFSTSAAMARPVSVQAPSVESFGEQPITDHEDISTEALVRQQWSSVDSSQLNPYLDAINQQIQNYMSPINPGQFISDFVRGNLDLRLSQIMSSFLRYFFQETFASAAILAQLVILVLLLGVFSMLQSAFQREAVGKLAYTVAYIAIIGVALSTFNLALDSGKSALDKLSGFMVAILPLLTTLTISSGGVASAGLFHPFMIGVVQVVTAIVKDFVFPLLLASAVVELAGGLVPYLKLSNISAFLRQLCILGLGAALSLFLGVVVIVGASGAASDGVTLRTAKFLSSAFVPVVGKMFADAAEVVLGSSLVLKNALGALGAVVVTLTAAYPLLKLLSVVILYRIAAILVQPIGADDVAVTLNGMGNTLMMIFIAVATVSIMYFITFAIIMGTVIPFRF